MATISFARNYKTITVKDGDTIKSIAKTYLKSKNNWQALLRYNRLKSANAIKSGMQLKIPYSLSKERVAKLAFKKGTVTVNGKDGQLNMLVRKGDKIKTGNNGRAILRLDDGSKVTIGKNSEIALTQYGFANKGRKSNVQLKKGGMLVKVNKLTKKNRFNVSSVTAVAGVRGTTFKVFIDKKTKESNFTVYAGKVDLADTNNNSLVSLKKGEAAKLSKNNLVKTVVVPEKIQWLK